MGPTTTVLTEIGSETPVAYGTSFGTLRRVGTR